MCPRPGSTPIVGKLTMLGHLWESEVGARRFDALPLCAINFHLSTGYVRVFL